MTDAMNRFNARLWGYKADNVFNPWNQCDPLDVSRYSVMTRRLNLETHFDRQAKYILIGEAPGYRGCHFSGVPFTCEAQFPFRITTRPDPWREASSTIIHETLKTLNIAAHTVMWNAFPFHPHEPFKPMSNRAPTNREVKDTRDILDLVLGMFQHAKRIAVGRVAATTLESLGYTENYCVRHPSMGGARDFRSQMRQLV
jgi:uracil-DNA glycosylase